jgi:hypothetical protein
MYTMLAAMATSTQAPGGAEHVERRQRERDGVRQRERRDNLREPPEASPPDDGGDEEGDMVEADRDVFDARHDIVPGHLPRTRLDAAERHPRCRDRQQPEAPGVPAHRHHVARPGIDLVEQRHLVAERSAERRAAEAKPGAEVLRGGIEAHLLERTGHAGGTEPHPYPQVFLDAVRGRLQRRIREVAVRAHELRAKCRLQVGAVHLHERVRGATRQLEPRARQLGLVGRGTAADGEAEDERRGATQPHRPAFIRHAGAWPRSPRRNARIR